MKRLFIPILTLLFALACTPDNGGENNGGNNGGGMHCGAFVGFVKVSTITENTMINSELAAAGATNNGVLAGKSDDASTFTDNAVSGTFYSAAITLDTKMIGAGNPTVTGTTLYTE